MRKIRVQPRPKTAVTAAIAAATLWAATCQPAALASTDSAAVGTATPAASTTAPPELDESSAAALAQQTGEAQTVGSETTPWSLTTAEPDGTMRTQLSVVPVRVREDGGDWVAADADLHVESDGALAPAATLGVVRLSGGGDGHLAQIDNNGTSFALSWPDALPTPTIEGSSATYPNVMPGVDLRVTVDTLGSVSDVLIVKTAQAAANPGLASVAFGADAGTGGITKDAAGNLTVTAPTGDPALESPTPLMWDSGTDTTPTDPPGSADDAASSPPDGAQVARVGVSVSDNSVDLTPNEALLTGPNTNYPVYIDPSWVSTTPSPSGYAWAQEAFPNSSWYNTISNGRPAVGYQGWQLDGTQGRNRSFWQYVVPAAARGAHINSATLTAPVFDSGDSTCSNTYKYVETNSAPIGSSTTWNNQPAMYAQQASDPSVAGHNAGCPAPASAQFNVTDAVVNDASDSTGIITFRISTPIGTGTDPANNPEYSKWYYKRFAATDTTLTISYNNAPDQPVNPWTVPAPVGGNCSGPPTPWLGVVPTTFRFSAWVSDPDTGQTNPQNISGRLEVWDKGGDGSLIPTVAFGAASSSDGSVLPAGGRVGRDINGSWLTNGHEYGMAAKAYDGIDLGPQSQVCYFWYDSTAPRNLGVTSTDFNATGSTKHINQAGTFTLSGQDFDPIDGRYSGVDHFDYSTVSASDLAGDGGTHKAATVSAASGTANITLTPTVWGINYLYVAAVDNAGNQSATYTYTYYAPDDPNAQPHAGDIDNDVDSAGAQDGHQPDVLLEYRTATANLNMFSTGTGQVKLASAAADSPDGTTWNSTLIAHRYSGTGARVDDLWALKHGSVAGDNALWLYTNNVNNAGGVVDNKFFTSANRINVPRPSCTSDDAACASYDMTDWAQASQIVAPGDINGDGKADLIVLETDGSLNNVWLFDSSTISGRLRSPILISSQADGTNTASSNWTNWRLISPGDVTNDGAVQGAPIIPDLVAVPKSTLSTGSMRMYPLNVQIDSASGQVTAASLGTYVNSSRNNFDAAERPLVTAVPADTTATSPRSAQYYSIFTGTPDQLLANTHANPSSSSFSVLQAVTVDDGSFRDWSDVTAMA